MRTVGILGTGGIGSVHARQYAKFNGLRILAYDIDAERAASFVERTGAEVAKSADELIQRADIVDICLPTNLHLEFARKSLQAGKPTFCEKPLCRTTKECAELAELSEKLAVPLMPAQVVRYFPEFRRAHELIKDGAVGRPAAIRTRRGGGFPKGSAWFGNFEQSGGVIMDLAIHDFDWIRWTFGEVKRVFSQSLTFSGIQNLDYSLTTLSLASGAVAHVEGTWADPGGFRVTFEVAGSEGFIEHDSLSTQTLKTANEESKVSEAPLQQTDDPYYQEISAFLQAVEEVRRPPVTAEDGLHAVAICEAALQSVRTGRAVQM